MNISYILGCLFLVFFIFLIVKLKKLANRQFLKQLQKISFKLDGIYDEGSFLYFPSLVCIYKKHRIKISSFSRGPRQPKSVTCWYFLTQLTDSKLPNFDIRASKDLYFHTMFAEYDSIYVNTENQSDVKQLFSANILLELNTLFLKYPALHFKIAGNTMTLSFPVNKNVVDIEDAYLFFTGYIDRMIAQI